MGTERFEFGGISGNMYRDVERFFEEVYDSGDEQVYQTREYTEHEEEDFHFHFHYIIRVMDLYELTGEDEHEGKSSIDIEMMVHPRHLKPELVESIMESMGLDEPSDMNAYDLLLHGGATITMASELVPNEDVPEKLLGAMNAIDGIDSMRGFFLDKAWNGIGTTGWDVIMYAIGKKENLFY